MVAFWFGTAATTKKRVVGGGGDSVFSRFLFSFFVVEAKQYVVRATSRK